MFENLYNPNTRKKYETKKKNCLAQVCVSVCAGPFAVKENCIKKKFHL